MRIISGSLKGRKLVSWTKKIPVRPMTDRIKESLFNVLTPYFFEDCLFLDLFSGTGSLALEALSRGAGAAHAVEQHPLCINLIKANSKILPDSKKLIVHKKSVFSFIKQSKIVFDIIVADPPFPLKYGEKIIENLQKSPLTRKGTVVVLETGREEVLKNLYKNFYLFSQKKFNDKKIWFYEHR